MATTLSPDATQPGSAGLQALARRPLWLHFTRMCGYGPDVEIPIIVRGEGSYVYRRGLICRTDDRGDPVITLAPPLIAGPQQCAEIEAVLRPVLTEASRRAGL